MYLSFFFSPIHLLFKQYPNKSDPREDWLGGRDISTLLWIRLQQVNYRGEHLRKADVHKYESMYQQGRVVDSEGQDRLRRDQQKIGVFARSCFNVDWYAPLR